MRSFYRLAVLFAAVSLVSIPSFGQDDLDQLFEGSKEDATKLIRAYIEPVMKSVPLSLNQGWYNTAKPHKIAGVDLTITVNAMTIPDKETLFEPGKLGLQEVTLDPSSPGYPKVPTIVGPDRESTYRVQDENGNTVTFSGPPGVDLKANAKSKLPVPMVHFGFGLPKGTDVKIRLIPELELGDEGTVKMFGIGVMHDIKQWIPGIKLMPFDLSAFVGYTKFDLQSELDQDAQGNPQTGVFTMNATTIQGVISKKFSVITFYGGLGYNIAKSNIALKGNYEINNTTYKDPIDLNFAASGPRATVGTRLKLAVFTFHADYTIQKYKCLTVGFGISVR